MGNNSEYLAWFKARLLSQLPQVKSVYLAESIDFLGRSDDEFPLIEMQFLGLPGSAFTSQRQRTKNTIIALQAYVKRPARPNTDEDMYAIVDLQEEIDKVIFGIYDAVIADDPTLPKKFLRMHAMYDSYVVHEIEPQISSCLFEFSAEFTS